MLLPTRGAGRLLKGLAANRLSSWIPQGIVPKGHARPRALDLKSSTHPLFIQMMRVIHRRGHTQSCADQPEAGAAAISSMNGRSSEEDRHAEREMLLAKGKCPRQR